MVIIFIKGHDNLKRSDAIVKSLSTSDIRLCNLRVTTIKTDINLSDVKSNCRDFITKDLSMHLNVATRNETVVRTYLALAGKSFKPTDCLNEYEFNKVLINDIRKQKIDARIWGRY